MNDNISTEVEEQFREIAREEAQDVYDVQVEDSDGSSWSLSSIMKRFEVDRRTALKALGLVAVGYTAPIAVLKALSGTAQAAATDDLTVPGTLDAGSIITGQIGNNGSDVVFNDDIDLNGNEIENGTLAGFEVYELNIDDGSKAQFDTIANFGVYMITAGASKIASIVSTLGGFEQVDILADPNGNVTTTEGNGGTLNIYYDSTNSRYEAENNTGSNEGFRIFAFRRGVDD